MKRLFQFLFSSLLLLCFIIHCDTIYASDYKYSLDVSIQGVKVSGKPASDSVNLSGNQPIYLVCTNLYQNYDFFAYSKEPFTNSQNYISELGAYRWFCPNSYNTLTNVSCKYYYIKQSNSYNESIRKLLNGDDSDFEVHVVEGTVENPIEDEDIGTLVLDKTVMYNETNGDDINDLYNLWSWKNKTSTGFSLSDNKYARTFIQVKVESKCVVYSDLRHTKVKENFANYGETAILYDSLPCDQQPLKISYLYDILSALPLTKAEEHNPLYTGYNYTLYFRVVCTNDLSVIPSSSGKWYSGGWRACDCNADILNKQSDHTSNGHFNDDGVWVDDTDDGHNQITSGSDAVTDTDEAKDNFSDFHPSSDMSTDTAIGNLKSLMDMVGYIPTMIATLFSFLPSWCITLIAVTFASMLVLIVYKLIRG